MKIKMREKKNDADEYQSRKPDYTTYISKISGNGFLKRQIVVANNPFEAVMKLANIYREEPTDKELTSLEITVQETEVVQ